MQPTSKESGPNAQGLAVTVLPPGASRTLLFKGGPHPWVGKPSFFFSDGIERQKNSFLNIIPVLSPVEVEDETVARATMMEGTALPHHAAVVTCLKVSLTIITIIIIIIIIPIITTCLQVGSTKVEVGVGNKVSATNKKPGFQKRGVLVHCSAPAKISKVEVNITFLEPILAAEALNVLIR